MNCLMLAGLRLLSIQANNKELARTIHKYARALAGALFSQGIFLSRPDPLVRQK